MESVSKNVPAGFRRHFGPEVAPAMSLAAAAMLFRYPFILLNAFPRTSRSDFGVTSAPKSPSAMSPAACAIPFRYNDIERMDGGQVSSRESPALTFRYRRKFPILWTWYGRDFVSPRIPFNYRDKCITEYVLAGLRLYLGAQVSFRDVAGRVCHCFQISYHFPERCG